MDEDKNAPTDQEVAATSGICNKELATTSITDTSTSTSTSTTTTTSPSPSPNPPLDVACNNDKKRKLSSSPTDHNIETKCNSNTITATKAKSKANNNLNANAKPNESQINKEKSDDDKTKTKIKTKKLKTKHQDPKILSLRRTVQKSCATNDFQTAIQAYQTLHIEQKVALEPQSFYNLLNLCAGGLNGGERGIHIGTPKPGTTKSDLNSDSKQKEIETKKEEDEDTTSNGNEKNGNENENVINYTPSQRKEYAFQIKNEMNNLQIPLNETAYTALMRIVCQPANNNLDEAIEILKQAENTQQCKPKLRMYSCLIDAFCNTHNNNLKGALEVWNRMNQLKRKDKNGHYQIGIEPTEREYCTIMKCSIRVGDVGVMERVVSEIAEDVLVPGLDTKDTIISWFQSKYAVIDTRCDNGGGSVMNKNISVLDNINKDSNLQIPTSNAPSMGPLQYVIATDNDKKSASQSSSSATIAMPTTATSTNIPKWEITSGDTINTKDGVFQTGCLEGQSLKPVPLNKDSWKQMIEMNEEIVVKGEIAEHGVISEFAGGGKGKKRILTKESLEKRIQQWDSFKAFLMERVGPPCCNMIDDCEATSNTTTNTNTNGKKRFDVVIDGANVGYYKRNFAYAPKYVDYKQIDWVVEYFRSQGKSVLLFMHERHFSKNLMPRWAEGIVKKWENDGTLYRTPHGSNDDWFWMHTALWCGRGTMVVSNDLMRDHHFQMLAYRSFSRWRERHQVYFDLGSWDSATNRRNVVLMYPDVYSRRIQRVGDYGLAIPLPKRGDENRFLDGFHEADASAPIEETFVCIHFNLTSD